MTRTAREVVELYDLVVWNERNVALAEELMGDTVILHDVGEAKTLTHGEAVSRVVDHWAMFDAIRRVDRIRKEFDYGADAVILHGATPDELQPIVTAYRA